jgi:hypothetical protein
MIRLDDGRHGGAMTLPKACEWIGERTGKTPATSTIWRWTLRGVRGGIKLESFRVGGTTFTTPAMVAEFIERTSFAEPFRLPERSQAVELDVETRRQEIAAAQDRLRAICAPKRMPRQSSPRT